ncbi:hypothetical protein [Duganella qianjiadongensis]|uniref:ABC transporter permease n=1 Tax=Duganella qianjiadongensis TaxID=2692176 RepID=A0ABW9VEL4_9BURK|nr:hypothetical protein [Duganella qianjiadongensis]MYM37991.1 hypothetical protein [Duganella qianjiadongensis]
MNTMKWLIKREMWEHKGMLLWTPVVVASLVAILAITSIFLGKNASFAEAQQAFSIGTITIEGKARMAMVDAIAHSYIMAAAPVLALLSLLVFFYCLGALHDERRDRSLLFWKSLPVSDAATVASKAILALAIAPLITMAVALVLALVILMAGSVLLLIHGTNLFGGLLLNPNLYLSPLRLLSLLPVYIIWALPTVGWLLMVSSMARSKVFLWAVGTPVIASLLLMWADRILQLGLDGGWFTSHITNRILLGVVPGSWMGFEMDNVMQHVRTEHLAPFESIYYASWHTLTSPSAWIGAAAGLAMLAIAVRMRQRREEV